MILKTSDKGVTWKRLLGITGNEEFTGVSFWTDQEGVVSGQNGLIYKTIDGGVNWIQISTGLAQNLSGVYFCEPGKGFAWGENKVFISNDTAKTWKEIKNFPDPAIYKISFISPKVGYYSTYSNVSKIYATKDGGSTWIDQAPAVNSSGNSVAFYFIDEKTAFFGSYQTIFKTNNGGADVQVSFQFDLGSSLLTDIYFVNKNVGFAVGKSNQYEDGYGRFFFKTNDGGVTWNTVDYSPKLKGQDILKASSLRYYVFGGNSPVFRSDDGCNTWKIDSVFLSGRGYRFGQQLKNGDLLIQNDDYYYRSADKGENWIKKSFNLPDSAVKYPFMLSEFITKDTFVLPIYTNSGQRLFLTQDGAASWQTIYPPPSLSILQYKFFSVDSGYLVGFEDHPTIYRTYDQGLHWQLIFKPDSLDNTFLKCDFINDSTIITLSGNYPRLCYKSTDRGDHWKLLTLPGDQRNGPAYFYDFFNDQFGTVVGTDENIYSTTDSAKTWNFRLASIVAKGLVSGIKYTAPNEIFIFGEDGRFQRLTEYVPAQPSLIKSPAKILKDSAYEFSIPMDLFSFDTHWEATGSPTLDYDSAAPDRVRVKWGQAGSYSVTAYSKTPCGNSAPTTINVKVLDPASTRSPNSDYLIYPNPTHEVINFEFETTDRYKYLTIYNINGAVMRKMEVPIGDFQIKVSSYPPGVYLVRFLTWNGKKSVVSKFLVQ